MGALPITVVISATTSLALGATFLYLWWVVLRRRYVLLLGAGRLLLVPFVVLMAVNASRPSAVVVAVAMFFSAASLVAWVAGIYDFVYRRLRLVPLLVFAAAMTAWQVLGPLVTAEGTLTRELPGSIARAAVYLWTAWLIYRGPRATGRRMLAVLVALNGVHSLDYPFLARQEFGIPLGLTISTFLAITLSMVLLVLLLDESRLAAAEAERERAAMELRATAEERSRQERQRVRQEAVLRLAGQETLFAMGLDVAWRVITETAAATLGVDRAGVWLTTGQATGLRCADLYERGSGRHSAGAEMVYASAPTYFRSFETGRTVAVPDAWTDPRAAELRTTYLEPTGVRSMLDAPIRVRGATVGVVCIEDSVVREWTPEDESFAVSLASLSVLVMEVHVRRQTAEALRESELRYRAAFQQAAVGLAEIGPGGEILRANRRLCDLVGYAEHELVRLRFPDLIHPDDVQDELEFLRRPESRGEAFHRRPRYLRKDGAIGWAAVTTATVRASDGGARFFLSVFEDVTERVSLEAQLVQAQKQEALGRLAGGVAHDFNNILSAVLGYTDLLRQTFAAGDPRHQDVDEIQRAGERAAALVRQLLAFARRQPVEPRLVRPDEVVRNLDAMLRRLIGADVTMRLRAAPDVPAVRVDPGRFEQVIVNLVVNAREAMPDGGTLGIEVGDVFLDEEHVRLHRDSRVGRHVLIAVSDTGCGMSPRTMERIFEPFFSTKPAGKGAGLGLATAYGIVRQAGGTIWVYSEEGRGTTFKIFLPVAEGAPEGAASPAAPAELPRGNETVLLVEDEDAVRAMVARVLAAAGYDVLEAPDGRQALALAAAHAGEIHLLVTDVVMPGMGGAELARRLAGERADLKVVFISGYNEDRTERLTGIGRASAYLAKPFSVAALARQVRTLLDGAA